MTSHPSPASTPFRRLLDDLNRREALLASQPGLSLRGQLVICALTLLALFSRCPYLLTHTQFYAEDGTVWYAQAYNSGWLHSLTLPGAGYLNTLQRLVAGPSLFLPLRHVPFFMTFCGLLIHGLPVAILLSSRCRRWAPLSLRLLFAALYIAIPNAREIYIVLTNAQWHLAVALLLLAFSTPPESIWAKLFDTTIFLISGFSGPFSLPLWPLLLFFWWRRRQSWSLVQLGVMSVGSLVQALVILHHHADRVHIPLRANPHLFIRMLGGNAFTAAIFGAYPFGSIAPFPLLLIAFIGGLALIAYTSRFSLEIALFSIFSLVIFVAGIRSPLGAGWPDLVHTSSLRYWYFPMLAFVWCSAWCAVCAKSFFFRRAATCILILMPIGIVADWHYRSYGDQNFSAYVQKFNDARPGQRIIIPIIPKGIAMALVKK
jgi:hypothetical protein